MAKARYDAEVDALYVYLVDQPTKVATSKQLGDLIIADYGDDGAIIGLEVVGVTKMPPPRREQI